MNIYSGGWGVCFNISENVWSVGGFTIDSIPASNGKKVKDERRRMGVRGEGLRN